MDDHARLSSGVVTAVSSAAVSVAFDHDDSGVASISDSDRYRIVKLANDVTYRRLKR